MYIIIYIFISSVLGQRTSYFFLLPTIQPLLKQHMQGGSGYMSLGLQVWAMKRRVAPSGSNVPMQMVPGTGMAPHQMEMHTTLLTEARSS